MLDQYFPVLLQIILAAGFAAVTLFASVIFGKSGRTNAMKDSAYECGMLPLGDAQPRFSVKFYLVAMLFVIFDLEVVYLYPWAVIYREMIVMGHSTVFWGMAGFVGILLAAYAYAWKKGALSWK